MRPLFLLALLPLVALGLAACASPADRAPASPPEPPASATPPSPPDPGATPAESAPATDSVFTVAGTVRRIELEGGGWLIEAEGGTRYQPLALDEAFRQDGLAVTATLRPRPDMMSTLMAGALVDVVSIRRR